MERFVYLDGEFFDRVSNTAGEMARSLDTDILSIEQFKDSICGLSEKVFLKSKEAQG